MTSRPSGKTFAQPVGYWPRIRALRFEIKGSLAYPDAGPFDPRPAYGEVLANQDENDEALRRAAHRELDRLLDKVLPQMPLDPTARWIAWNDGDGTYHDWQAHLITERHTRRVSTACGLIRHPLEPGQEATYPVEPFNDEIKCQTCWQIAKAKT
jgi:hypothetical protein